MAPNLRTGPWIVLFMRAFAPREDAMKSRKRQRGFSLVEVMVATVVVGLTLAAGIPAFARFTQTARLEGAARQMVGHFRLARQKAVAGS